MRYYHFSIEIGTLKFFFFGTWLQRKSILERECVFGDLIFCRRRVDSLLIFRSIPV